MPMDDAHVNELVFDALFRDIAELEAELFTYRESLAVSLAQQAELLSRHNALKQQHAALREELRRYVEMQVGATA